MSLRPNLERDCPAPEEVEGDKPEDAGNAEQGEKPIGDVKLDRVEALNQHDQDEPQMAAHIRTKGWGRHANAQF